jgi:thiamine pyrophosphokinase
MAKTTIAILYDFDKTLCTTDMQEYDFIHNLGLTPSQFWSEAGEITKQHSVDKILAYMFLMIKKCKEKGVRARIITKTQTLELINDKDNFTVFKCKCGGYVSLFPITQEVSFISSDGLKYSLKGIVSKQGETLTLSNQAIGESFTVEIKDGNALLVAER